MRTVDTKKQIIELVEENLQEVSELYNQLGEGEVSFTEAGKKFDSVLAWKTITALKETLKELRGE